MQMHEYVLGRWTDKSYIIDKYTYKHLMTSQWGKTQKKAPLDIYSSIGVER